MSIQSGDVTKQDIQLEPILTDIENIKLELIENKTFVDQDVYLDGRDFVSCIFKNCTIHIKLGHFTIRGSNTILTNCNFKYYPPAEAVKSISDIIVTQQNK